MRNTPGHETTCTWKVSIRLMSVRPPGHGDPLNLAREFAIYMSGTPSCRPAMVLRTLRIINPWARPLSRSRRRKPWPGPRTRGRARRLGARRRCVVTRPAHMTGQHGFTNCSPIPTGATCKNTGTGRPFTGARPAKTAPPQTEYCAPITLSRRSREDSGWVQRTARDGKEHSNHPRAGHRGGCRVGRRGRSTAWAAQQASGGDSGHPAGRPARSRRRREGAAQDSRSRGIAASGCRGRRRGAAARSCLCRAT